MFCAASRQPFALFKEYQLEPLEKIFNERKNQNLSVENIELSLSESYRILKTYEEEIEELEKKIKNLSNIS